LLDDGLVPTEDFAYVYGLLSLVIHRAVFAVFGATPHVTGAMFVSCAVLIAFGVWRLLRILEVGIWPRLLLLPLVILVANPGNFPSPVQAFEAALLVHALAYQARGRLGTALAFVTIAVLVKPSLGYFFGLVLVIQILLTPGDRGRLRPFLPALVLGLGLTAYLAALFGLDPLLSTQLPGEAQKVYRDQNCGFFRGDGQVFWKPQPGRPRLYYFLSPAGVWLGASVLTTFGGLVAIRRCRSDPAARFVATASLLNGLFVAVLFANRFSWIYYPYLPFVAVVVTLDRLPRWIPFPGVRFVAAALGAILCLFASTQFLVAHRFAWKLWTDTAPDPRTGGLFAPPGLASRWERVRGLAASGTVFVLTRSSCARAFGDGLESPDTCYLSRAVATPVEWARMRVRIAQCEWLLVPVWFDNNLLAWPELADVLAPFRMVEDHGAFKLYRRVESPGR